MFENNRINHCVLIELIVILIVLKHKDKFSSRKV
jgi:hypothetical protein